MSTVKAINLQHPTAANANIVLDSAGRLLANNVGIGTTTPNEKLEVYANTTGGNGAIKVSTQYGAGYFGTYNNYPAVMYKSGTDWRPVSVYDTNNSLNQLYTGGIERLRIDGSGYVTKPYQPSVIATRSSHVTTTMSPIIFDNIVNQTGNCYNASTGLFTAPVTGWYNVSHCFIFYSLGSSTYTWIYKNGSTYGPTSLGSYGAFTGSYAGQGGSLMVYASTGDTLGIGCTHNGTSLHAGYIGLSITLMS